MRRELLDTAKDLERLRKRTQELEREAADRERELLRLKAERRFQTAHVEYVFRGEFANTSILTVDAAGHEESAALAALKSSDELISDSLRTELEATRKQLTQKAFELDETKEQLMGTLLSKDKVQRKLDDAMASAGQQQPEEAQQPKSKKEDAEKIEKLKAALRQKIEVSKAIATGRGSILTMWPLVMMMLHIFIFFHGFANSLSLLATGEVGTGEVRPTTTAQSR
jgi:protein HOOK3